MKTVFYLFFGIATVVTAFCARGQSMTNLDLSTRCLGVPLTHQTVSSAAKWMQNPVDQKLEIVVTNLYADATAYMEIDVADQQLKFYGAGKNSQNQYIATNYAPIEVDV